MKQIISYINFLFKATNHHAVHSPFVYSFVTQCLYNKKDFKDCFKLKQNSYSKEDNLTEINIKTLHLICKTINYFNISKIFSPGAVPNIVTEIMGLNTELFTKQKNAKQQYDAALFLTPIRENNITKTFEELHTKMHNDSLLMVCNIHNNREASFFWQLLKNHKVTTVTVDCFYIGFVFFRKEQAKQHFRIRL